MDEMTVKCVAATNQIPQEVEVKQVKEPQPQVDLSDPVDVAQFSTKTEEKPKSNKFKKLATAYTSTLYPGLGQVINGDTKSAAKHFFGAIGCDALAIAGAGLTAVCLPVGIALMTAGCVGHIGTVIHSIVDAYKKA